MKRKLYAYILWLIGGIFGLHHVYLKRDRHAFIWFSTFGGFIIGYLYDLFRMSEYLDYANNDDDFLNYLYRLMNRLKSPCFKSSYRFLGSIAVATLYGYIVQYSLPIEYADTNYLLFYLVQLLAPLACAIGAYLVNTESYMQCDFKWSLIGSYIAILPLLFQHQKGVFYCAISSTLFTHWQLEWRAPVIAPTTSKSKEKPKAKAKQASLKKRLAILFVCAAIYGCFATSFFLHNATITIDGQTTPLKDAITNFFKSRAFQDLKTFFIRMWHIYRLYGFQRLKEEFLFGVDAYGITRAYEVLGLDESVNQKELDAKCRELSRKWHPDRYKNEEEKKEAEKKFMDIQEACNKVSSHRRSKADKNKKTDEELAKENSTTNEETKQQDNDNNE